MLVTGLAILQYSMYADLNLFEIIFLRASFSIYIGWVTAANILNVVTILYASNLRTNQVMWSKVILVVAYVIYSAYAFIERNPLFALVFIWVLISIRANQFVGKSNEKSAEIATHCTRLIYLHRVTLAAAIGLCFYEIGNKTLTHGLPHGLFF